MKIIEIVLSSVVPLTFAIFDHETLYRPLDLGEINEIDYQMYLKLPCTKEVEHVALTEPNTTNLNYFTFMKYTGDCNLTKTLSLTNQGIKSISDEAFSQFTGLKHLILAHNSIETIEPFAFLYLDTLTYLDISNNAIREIQNYTFSGLSGLTHLFMGGNLIYTIQPDSFKDLPYLETVVMRKGCGLSFHSDIFGAQKNLRNLDISGMCTHMNYKWKLPVTMARLNISSRILFFSSIPYYPLPYLLIVDASNFNVREIPIFPGNKDCSYHRIIIFGGETLDCIDLISQIRKGKLKSLDIRGVYRNKGTPEIFGINCDLEPDKVTTYETRLMAIREKLRLSVSIHIVLLTLVMVTIMWHSYKETWDLTGRLLAAFERLRRHCTVEEMAPELDHFKTNYSHFIFKKIHYHYKLMCRSRQN